MSRRPSLLRLAFAAFITAISAIAVVTLPILARPAAAAVPGLTTVFQYTSYTSGNKGLRADCPSSTVLIGTSQQITGGEGQVRWDQVVPYTDHLYVHAVEDEDGYAYTWSLGVTIICATRPAGYEIVASTSTTTSNLYNSVAADCTGTNQLLGLGFTINGGNGEVGVDDMKATSTTRATGWAYEDRTGFSGQWSLTQYAICASPLAGYERIEAVGSDQSAMSAIVTADCSGGKRIVGGGGQVDGGAGLVILEDFSATYTSYSVKAYEDQTGTGNQWHLHAYALCATP